MVKSGKQKQEKIKDKKEPNVQQDLPTVDFQKENSTGFNSLYWIYFLIGAILRYGVFYYLEIARPDLSITDLDYWVYLDGAKHIVKGESPYLRHTYRYTPLLAQIMTISVDWLPMGKLFLITSDLVGALYIKFYLDLDKNLSKDKKAHLSALWLLNPLTIHISLRGSCESIQMVLMAKTLYHLKAYTKSHRTSWFHFVWAALAYGLLVHYRVYPIVFALPIYMSLNHNKSFFHFKGILFGILSGGIFLGLFGYYFLQYGMEFAQEGYFYHIGRKDHRHSYSIFFITSNYFYDRDDRLIGFLTKGPKFFLVLLSGFHLYKNLGIAFLTQTFIFIMLNTVYTAQYIVWVVMCFPFAFAYNKLFSSRKWILSVSAALTWVAFIVYWAVLSDKFENQGFDTLIDMHWLNVAYFWFHLTLFYLYFKYHNRLGQKASDYSGIYDQVATMTNTNSSKEDQKK